MLPAAATSPPATPVNGLNPELELAYFRAALDAFPDAFYIVDAQTLSFVYVNRAACELRGVTPEQYLGQKPWESTQITREQLQRDYEELIAAAGRPQRREFLGTSMDGSRGWMDLQRQAVLLDGRWLVTGVMRNVTERKLAEQAATRHRRMYATLSDTNEAIMHAGSAEELYQRVCNAAVQSGGFVTAAVLVPDEASGRMRVEVMSGGGQHRLREVRISIDAASPEGRGLVGMAFRSRESQVSNDFLKDERTTYWYQHAREVGIKSSAAIPLLRGERPDGVLLLYSGERRAFDDEVVKLLERMAENISFALDNIERDTERKRVGAALLESEARFRALTHLSSDWYWERDAELRFTRFESRSTNSGDLGKNVLDQRPWELAFEIEAGGEVSSFRSLLEVPQPYRDVVQSRLGSDGKRRYFSVSGEPLFGNDGRFSGYRGVSKDITAQRVADERIKHLATHDGLTGLPNRAVFSQLLDMEIQLATRYERKFGLLYVDLDGFKYVNDTLGHDAGDALLKDMSARFKAVLRTSDTVSRFGGDEFVALVREVRDAEDLTTAARKILAAAIKRLEILEKEYWVSASIGIAIFPDHARDEQSLMKNADTAMYLAKRGGKNRFHFYVS